MDMPVTLPCGQCSGCRLERSRQWAVRCVHEAQLHMENSFVTLTYDNEHLPEGDTLVKRHFQLFMKRLRKRFSGKKIAFFYCGEYGEQCRRCGKSRRDCRCAAGFVEGLGRPHYHAILFGVGFRDRVLWKEERGNKIYVSALLDCIWGQGFCSVGDVTFESSAYVARYVMKKVTGDKAAGHYEKLDPDTGEIYSVVPEFCNMSLRCGADGKGGIGSDWFAQFKGDVFPKDFITCRGVKQKPPRYYQKLFEIDSAAELDRLKLLRIKSASKHKADNTPDRLAVREQVHIAQISMLKRSV